MYRYLLDSKGANHLRMQLVNRCVGISNKPSTVYAARELAALKKLQKKGPQSADAGAEGNTEKPATDGEKNESDNKRQLYHMLKGLPKGQNVAVQLYTPERTIENIGRQMHCKPKPQGHGARELAALQKLQKKGPQSADAGAEENTEKPATDGEKNESDIKRQLYHMLKGLPKGQNVAVQMYTPERTIENIGRQMHCKPKPQGHGESVLNRQQILFGRNAGAERKRQPKVMRVHPEMLTPGQQVICMVAIRSNSEKPSNANVKMKSSNGK